MGATCFYLFRFAWACLHLFPLVSLTTAVKTLRGFDYWKRVRVMLPIRYQIDLTNHYLVDKIRVGYTH